MTILMKTLAAAASVAAIAAAPAAAQYNYGYGYNPYGYNYGYQANANTYAVQRCNAAVQSRLSQRNGLVGILGAVLGARATGGRVLAVTDVDNRRNVVRVRGLANSGASYGPYGIGAYGAVGYGYQPDLSFKCDVDYRGYVRDVDIRRRR